MWSKALSAETSTVWTPEVELWNPGPALYAAVMSWAPTLVERGSDGGRDPEDVLESLVLYAAAGMAAPVPVGMPAAVAAAGGRA